MALMLPLWGISSLLLLLLLQELPRMQVYCCFLISEHMSWFHLHLGSLSMMPIPRPQWSNHLCPSGQCLCPTSPGHDTGIDQSTVTRISKPPATQSATLSSTLVTSINTGSSTIFMAASPSSSQSFHPGTQLSFPECPSQLQDQFGMKNLGTGYQNSCYWGVKTNASLLPCAHPMFAQTLHSAFSSSPAVQD